MTAYYLDNSSANSSNNNSGTSEALPFQTLAALNRAFAPGDTVNIKAGTSYSGTLTITADGTAAAPITFTKYGAGDDPIINTNNYSVVQLQGANHVILEELNITGSGTDGVSIDGSSNNNTVRNLEIRNVGYGVEVAGNNNLITNNAVHDLHMIVNTQGGDDDYGANGFQISGDGNELSFNHVWKAEGPSYDYGEDGGGFETWGTVNGLKIHDNLVEDSNGFIEIGGPSGSNVSNVEVYNNISSGNGGFHYLHNAPGTGNFGVTLSNMTVSSNTVYEPNGGNGLFGFGGPVAAGSYSFTDNLVYAPNATNVFNQTGNFHTGNFYQIAGTPSGTGEVKGQIAFANPAADDFHVTSGNAANYGVVYSDAPPPVDPPPPATVTPANYSFGTGSDTLVLKITQDAYNGGAQYTVSIDGQQIGGTLTAASLHGSGQFDTVTIKGDYAAGSHAVSVNFLNDAYGGTDTTDRNLYVDSATYDGAAVSGATFGLYSNGAAGFSVTDTTAPATTAPPAGNTITGTNRANTLNGTAGNDIIDSKQGNDIINSGGGNDTMIFHTGDGWDWISDFSRGSDVLKMVGIAQNEVTWKAATWNGVGAGIEVDYVNDLNGGVFLKGVYSLAYSDFVFA